MYKITKITLSMFLACGIFDRIKSSREKENEYYENKDPLDELLVKLLPSFGRYREKLESNQSIKQHLDNYYSAIDEKIIKMNLVIRYIKNVIGYALKQDREKNLTSYSMIVSLYEYSLIENDIERNARIDSIMSFFKLNMPTNMPKRYRNLINNNNNDNHNDNQFFEEYLSSKEKLLNSKKILDEALKEGDFSDPILDKDFDNLTSDYFKQLNSDLEIFNSDEFRKIFNSDEFKENIKNNIKEFLMLNSDTASQEGSNEYDPVEFEKENDEFEKRPDIQDAKNRYLEAIS